MAWGRWCAAAAVAVVAVSTAPPADAGTSTGTSCGRHLSERLAAFAARHPAIRLDVGVRDLTNAATYGVHRHRQQITASIVKVEILETLLHRHPNGLSAELAETARGMIEWSDNNDAQTLFDRIGDSPGLAAFGRRIGLRETVPGGGVGAGYLWGLTLTTPADQLRVLALLAADNRVLTHDNRLFALDLMHHVNADQRWGVTTGTAGDRVAVKNGWLEDDDGSAWQINSIGYVNGPTRHYLIAIQSYGAPDMGTGVHVVNAASALIARLC